MKKKFEKIHFALAAFCVLVLGFISIAPGATVTGHAYLQGQTNNSGIHVTFTAITPSAQTDSTQTDSTGLYTLVLSTGYYTAGFTHTSYYPSSYPDTLFATGTDTLLNDTLVANLNVTLSGNISGALFPGIRYAARGNLTVPAESTLTILPGTVIEFDSTVRLSGQGHIIARGSIGDSIYFTSSKVNPSPGSWGGISLANFDSQSVFTFCRIEYSGGVQTELYSQVRIDSNLFTQNSFGVNATGSHTEIIGNSFVSNGQGVVASAAGGGNGETDWAFPENSDIEGNLFEYNQLGVNLFGTSSRVANNIFRQNTVAIQSSYGYYISSLHYTGIGLFDVCVIQANVFTGNSLGISLHSSYATVTGNLLEGFNGTGIAMDIPYVGNNPLYSPPDGAPHVTRNILKQFTGTGMSSNWTVPRITLDTVLNLSGEGIVLSNSSRVVVDSNLIAYDTGAAIANLQNTSYGLYNTIHDCDTGITSEGAYIESNVIYRVNYAIICSPNEQSVISNTINSVGVGLMLNNTAASVIEENAFTNCQTGIITDSSLSKSKFGYNDFSGDNINVTSPEPLGFSQKVIVDSVGDSTDTYYNIFYPPRYADTATGDFRLVTGSKLIHAGDPALPRNPDGTIADIGAISYNHAAIGGIDTIKSWRIHITASAGPGFTAINYLGINDSATDGFDAAFDIPEPPTPAGSFVELYFPHPEYSQPTGNNFSRDIRGPHLLADSVLTWNMSVVTNIADTTVSLSFTADTSLSPKYGIVLHDVSNGAVKNLRASGMNYSYRSDSTGGTRLLQLIVGDTTSPSVTVSHPNGGEIIPAQTGYTVRWTVTDPVAVESTMVSVSMDSGRSYATVATLQGAATSYDWTPGAAYLTYGGSVRVTVVDSVGRAFADQSDHLFTIVGDSLAASFAAGWNLVGTPLEANNPSVQSTFGASQQYYFYSYAAQSGYQNPGTISDGRGYWLGLLNSLSAHVVGSAWTDSFAVPLGRGFNIISNPLVVPVPAESLTFENGATSLLYDSAIARGWIAVGIDGYSNQSNSYQNADTLAIWQGYWVGALDSGLAMVVKPTMGSAAPFSKAHPRTKQIASTAWQVNIAAAFGTSSDHSLYFGIRTDATDGYDVKYDQPKPPSPPGGTYIEAYFTHADWAPVLGDKFITQINSIHTISWSFTVAPSANGAVTLSWDANLIKSSVPDSIPLYLKDGVTGTATNMRTTGTYTYGATGMRQFSVNTNPLGVKTPTGLPREFALEQNYPNPFNPTSTIRYDLPKAAYVRLSVYNVLGQEVRTLVDRTETAGYKSVTFEGNSLPSGVYFYRLTAGSFNDVKKMILLK